MNIKFNCAIMKMQRQSLTDLLNMKIVFRDRRQGDIKHIPISSLVNVDYTSTLGSVKRKNVKTSDHAYIQMCLVRLYTYSCK